MSGPIVEAICMFIGVGWAAWWMMHKSLVWWAMQNAKPAWLPALLVLRQFVLCFIMVVLTNMIATHANYPASVSQPWFIAVLVVLAVAGSFVGYGSGSEKGIQIITRG